MDVRDMGARGAMGATAYRPPPPLNYDTNRDIRAVSSETFGQFAGQSDNVCFSQLNFVV